MLPLFEPVGEVVLFIRCSLAKGGGVRSNSRIIACTTRPRSEYMVNYNETNSDKRLYTHIITYI